MDTFLSKPLEKSERKVYNIYCINVSMMFRLQYFIMTIKQEEV